MTTSGTTSFNMTRNEIIRMAALKVNALGRGRTMSATMQDDFALGLNALVKQWHTKGIHVWTIKEATLFPQTGQTQYALGSGTDHCTEQYYETTISADEVVASTILSVTSTTNMTALDKIAVVLDDGTFFWSTIASKTATTVTINDAITDSAAALNAVYTYTSNIVKPLDIVRARRYDIASATDTPIDVVARSTYYDLPVKAESGTINQLYYDKQLNTGYVNLWQVPEVITEFVKFTWHKPLQDFTVAGDNGDIPQEWLLALVFNLAKISLTEYPVSPKNTNLIIDAAAEYLSDVVGFDRDSTSFQFVPNLEG